MFRNRLSFALAVVLALVVGLAGFEASLGAQDDPVVAKIIQLGRTDNQVMTWNDYASNRFGGRETGSNAYNDATQWAAWQFKQWGFDVALEEAAWEIFRRFPEIPAEEIRGFYAELETTEFLATRPVYPEAVAGVRTLAAAGHRLFVVTGRLSQHRDHTRRMLEGAGLLGLFEDLVHRDGESLAGYKPRVLRELGLQLVQQAVEETPQQHARAAAAQLQPDACADDVSTHQRRQKQISKESREVAPRRLQPVQLRARQVHHQPPLEHRNHVRAHVANEHQQPFRRRHLTHPLP